MLPRGAAVHPGLLPGSPRSWAKKVHLVAALAVLTTLFPMGDKLPAKPAGVRTAIELIDKKAPRLQSFTANGLKFVSRS
jgi:hypothetical protein